jgi:uncharacterized membrane protein YdjX (TVP38/TMEM64 family)
MRKEISKLKAFLPPLVILIIIGVLIYAKCNGVLDYMTSVEAFQKYIEGYGSKAYAIFFIIQIMSVIIAPIPSNISAAAGASIFGMWESFIISIMAITSGSVIVFLLAKKFGKPFTERFVSPKVSDKYEKLLSSKRGEILLAALFFLPFLPDDAICFLVGLSNMKFKKYFFIMVLTRPWGILAASAVGSSNVIIPWWGWSIIAVFIVLIIKYSNKLEDIFISTVKGI